MNLLLEVRNCTHDWCGKSAGNTKLGRAGPGFLFPRERVGRAAIPMPHLSNAKHYSWQCNTAIRALALTLRGNVLAYASATPPSEHCL